MVDENLQNESSREILRTERYLWIARAFSVVAVLSFFANILLLVSLGSLQPLTRIQPFLLNIQSKDQQVVDIVETGLEELQVDQKEVEEAFVRQYILARYTVTSDLKEVKKRWSPDSGLVRIMSSEGVWREFDSEKEARSSLNIAENEGMTRKVKIVTLDRDENGKWRVDLELETMLQSEKEPRRTKLIVQMIVGFQAAGKMEWKHRLRNPLGFKVQQYQFEVKKSSLDEKN